MIRRVGVAIILVAVALLVTSSVGVSTVAVERPVSIEVVDDESATVGFEDRQPVEPPENDSAVELLEVTNRAGTELDATVRETQAGDVAVGDLETGESIEPGESATVRAPVTCEGNTTTSIDVVVTGDGITVERAVAVDCR